MATNFLDAGIRRNSFSSSWIWPWYSAEEVSMGLLSLMATEAVIELVEVALSAGAKGRAMDLVEVASGAGTSLPERAGTC
jgi:hypothetical protein